MSLRKQNIPHFHFIRTMSTPKLGVLCSKKVTTLQAIKRQDKVTVSRPTTDPLSPGTILTGSIYGLSKAMGSHKGHEHL